MVLTRRIGVAQSDAEAKDTIRERQARHLEANLPTPPGFPTKLLGCRLAGPEQPTVGVPELDGHSRRPDLRRELDRKPHTERSAGETLPLLLTITALHAHHTKRRLL